MGRYFDVYPIQYGSIGGVGAGWGWSTKTGGVQGGGRARRQAGHVAHVVIGRQAVPRASLRGVRASVASARRRFTRVKFLYCSAWPAGHARAA